MFGFSARHQQVTGKLKITLKIGFVGSVLRVLCKLVASYFLGILEPLTITETINAIPPVPIMPDTTGCPK